MSTEQPNLFGEMVGEEKVRYEQIPEKKIIPTAFLPGVNTEEAYPEIKGFAELEKLNLSCEKCGLRSTCKQVVYGGGNPHADLLFIGEGPGADEDAKGIPFVGRSGKLFDKILAAVKFDREEIYITNVVKCRPPGNRLPNPNEVKVCRNYLEAQIRLMQPKIIVCLGSAASRAVIAPRSSIGQVRGRWLQRNGIKMMATYHPAALLRNESYKRPTWEDFKLIRDAYNEIRNP
ncbi:MAG: uracil-DNA glycosylase [Bacillota bacterium]|nr:uracil-DNA glycosylase [Bacillota bacterium]